MSREQFESEIVELDARMHPAQDAVSSEQREFASMAVLLACHLAMESGGPVTRARTEAIMTSFGLSEERLAEIAEELEWVRCGRTNTRQVLAALLCGRRSKWVPIHAGSVMRMVLIQSMREFGLPLPEPVQGALEGLGGLFQLKPAQLGALYEVLTDEIARELEEE